MRFVKTALIIIGTAAAGLAIVGKVKKPGSIYEDNPEEKNPMEGKMVSFIENPDEKENADGVCGHLESIGDSSYAPSFYEKYVKRCLDIVLSFVGLVALSPVFLGVSAAIIADDPGPVFFTQKRLGKNKQYFKLHKFRSMKMSTPHDKPTHSSTSAMAWWRALPLTWAYLVLKTQSSSLRKSESSFAHTVLTSCHKSGISLLET